MTKVRLAIIATHPIQHFVSFYRALSAVDGLSVRVLFASRMGLQPYFDVEMKQPIAWKMDLLSGYDHRFLTNQEAQPAPINVTISRNIIDNEFREFEPDAVIVYGYATPISRSAVTAARRFGAKTLMISDSELRARRSRIKRLAKAMILPLFYRRFDAFLTVGDENERYYRHYGVPQARLFRSPFTIDESAFRPVVAHRLQYRAKLIARLGITNDPFLVLFIGKLTERKRPGDVLEALQLASASSKRPIHAIFAGDGSLRKRLAQRIKDNLIPAHLLGFVNVDELPEIYGACDSIILPSSSDPHPLICSEAACVGMPVILSDRIGAEGPTDIARLDRNAFVFPVGDVKAMACILDRLANDHELVSRMGKESRRVFDELDMRRSLGGVESALASLGLTNP